jgi:hypothetical protein
MSWSAALPWRLLDDLRLGFRLIRDLPAYLRHPLQPDEARAILRRRLERREADFLHLARRAIFANRTSPYRLLLRQAGCELGDIERLVSQDGIEGALRILYRNGVYLTVDEFKGRRPATRGSAAITIDPRRLWNPLAAPCAWAATSGSRGDATQVPLGLASIRDRAVNIYLTLGARGGADWRHGVWGTPGIAPLLWYSAWGTPAARWFSQLDPMMPGLHPRYRWSVRLIHWASRLAGAPLPPLDHVPLDAPLPIADWMAQALRAGEVPHLWAFPSSAVRLCQAAEEAGLDLGGARLTVTGEPVTDARLAVIRRAGADPVPDYGSADSGGPMSYGCLAPEASDEVHFFHDLHALIQAEEGPCPAGALLVSSLRPTAPIVLLNVSMGDRAVATDRACGCPLEALGWRTHLHTIRSYEKLTAGGMTFIDTDVIRVLEEVLPRRFGGGPTDYQLFEEETDEGHPRLRILVAPSVGAVDGAAVSEAFLAAIGAGSMTARVMAAQWRQGGVVHVERRAPLATPSGKILHLRSPGQPSGRIPAPTRPAAAPKNPE